MDISVSPFGSSSENFKPVVESIYEWPEGSFLQAGHKGIVLSASGRSYTTAFLEAFLKGTFIRGEGATIEEAETAAWEKFQRSESCPKHEWESRGYTNGAGFCKHCNFFKSKVFTGEDLNQFCEICHVGTTWGATTNPQTHTEIWGCEEHIRQLQTVYMKYLHDKTITSELSDAERAYYHMLEFFLLEDADNEEKVNVTEFLDAFFRNYPKN